MTITIDGGAGITFPDTVQQTNGMTMTGGNPKYYAARAWVNFDGTGTVSIRAAVNVSSITDSGLGIYLVNFTTAMPDVNYAAVLVGQQNNGTTSNQCISLLAASDGGIYSTTQFTIFGQASNGNQVDSEIVCAAVFR
jgi:hypothetical protein